MGFEYISELVLVMAEKAKKKILSNERSKRNLATRERFWESLMKVTFGG